ncbi:hypothetical protein Tco_0162727 [Tanacetum coccineum]
MGTIKWKIHGTDLGISDEDLYACAKEDYEPHPTCFTLRIHHGGCFKFYPGRAYYEGKRSIVDMVNIKTFLIHELNDMVHDLGHTVRGVMFYNFQFIGDHKVIEVYIAHGCTKVYTYYNPKPTISSVENDEIHEDNDVVTSTYTQNVLKMLFFDMFPHHVDTSVDTQRFAKRLFLDTVPHVETQEDVVEESLNVKDYQLNDMVADHTVRVDANKDVNRMEVDSSTRVEESQGEVNETVVEDSWRVEHSYDDVASTDKIDDDSYVYERSGEDEDNFMFDENDLDVIDNEDVDSDSGEGCDIENIRSSKQKQLKKRRLQEDGVVNKHDFFVRQSFGSSKQIKDRVYMYSIETIKKLKLIRNDKRRVRAKYVGLMPFFDVNDNGLENMGIQVSLLVTQRVQQIGQGHVVMVKIVQTNCGISYIITQGRFLDRASF